MDKYEAVIAYYKAYMGDGAHLTIFWCAMFFLIVLALKKNDILSKKLVLYTALISVIYWNPVTSEFLLKYFTGNNVYCRMFWIFPITIVIAYAVVCAVKYMDNRIKRIILLAVSVIIIVCTGKYMFVEEVFSKADNLSKLPEPVPEICETVENDAKNNNISDIKAIVEDSLVCYIRQYDGNIKMNYGRDSAGTGQEFGSVLNAQAFDIDALLELAYGSDSNYLVLYKNKYISSAVESGKCRLVDNVGKYSIYYVENCK